jgi:hypothetical protein
MLPCWGVKTIVLECIPAKLGKKISQSLNIPTIGIGAGVDCDGQVLVSYDMLGITQNPPKFVKNFLTSGSIILLYSFLYNLQKLYIAIKEKSAFLIFIDTDLIAVFICWEGLVFNCLNKITSCRNNTATG